MTKDALQGFPSDTSSLTSLIIALEQCCESVVKKRHKICVTCATLLQKHSPGQSVMNPQLRPGGAGQTGKMEEIKPPWLPLQPSDGLSISQNETGNVILVTQRHKNKAFPMGKWTTERRQTAAQSLRVGDGQAAGSWHRAAEDEWDALLMAKSQTSWKHVLYSSNVHKHKKKKF